jgi:hypothetical protein
VIVITASTGLFEPEPTVAAPQLAGAGEGLAGVKQLARTVIAPAPIARGVPVESTTVML